MNSEAYPQGLENAPAVSASRPRAVFDFNLRTVKDTATNRLWFVGREVCEKLGTNAKDISAILEQEDYCSLLSLRGTPSIEGIKNLSELRKDTRMISEPGFYRLVCRSRKPEAIRFQEWLFGEVLPSIARRGYYFTPQMAEKIIENPDTIIDLALQLKADRERQGHTQQQLTPRMAVDITENLDLVIELAQQLKADQARQAALQLPITTFDVTPEPDTTR